MTPEQFQTAAERLAKIQAQAAAARAVALAFEPLVEDINAQLQTIRTELSDIDHNPRKYINREREHLELQRAFYRDHEVVAVARLAAYQEATRAAEVEHSRIRKQAEAAERLFNELIDNREAERQRAARERAEIEYQARRATK